MDAVIRVYYESKHEMATFPNSRISLAIKKDSNPLVVLSTELTQRQPVILKDKGYIDFRVSNFPFSQGFYDVTFFVESNGQVQDWFTLDKYLEVVDGNYYGTGVNYPQGWQGKTVLIQHEIKAN
jgi:lipopolysaccharide transport system ATP-binding protein